LPKNILLKATDKTTNYDETEDHRNHSFQHPGTDRGLHPVDTEAGLQLAYRVV
jgi:hypothetical protein